MYQLRKTYFKALRFLDCLKKALIVVYTHMHTYTQKNARTLKDNSSVLFFFFFFSFCLAGCDWSGAARDMADSDG